MARGEFIVIINSDDVFATNRIDRMLGEAGASDGREVFAFTDVDFIRSEGEPENEHACVIAYRDLRATCGALTQDVWFLAGNPAIAISFINCCRFYCELELPYHPTLRRCPFKEKRYEKNPCRRRHVVFDFMCLVCGQGRG
jgi:hypothetical protein